MERVYEVMLILAPVSEEEVKKVQETVEKVFASFGAKIKNLQVWGKRKLAYKIRGLPEGFYLLYELEILPSTIEALRTKLGRVENVLRSLISLAGR